jgi:hypothetical protein
MTRAGISQCVIVGVGVGVGVPLGFAAGVGDGVKAAGARRIVGKPHNAKPAPLDNSKVDAILKEDGLPVAGFPAPPMPLYIYQSMLDELVPVNDTDALVTTYCMQGTHIAYYVGAAGEHVAFDATMAPTVFAYFASRFAGRDEVVPLGTKTCN